LLLLLKINTISGPKLKLKDVGEKFLRPYYKHLHPSCRGRGRAAKDIVGHGKLKAYNNPYNPKLAATVDDMAARFINIFKIIFFLPKVK
jgi:hypothetical protein